jgi:hypothetical protein
MFKGIRDTRGQPTVSINYLKLCNGCNIPNKRTNNGESMMATVMKQIATTTTSNNIKK